MTTVRKTKGGKIKRVVAQPAQKARAKKSCDFCGRVEKAFLQEERLEEHVWREVRC